MIKTLLIFSSFTFLAISAQALAFDDFNKATLRSAKIHTAGSPPLKVVWRVWKDTRWPYLGISDVVTDRSFSSRVLSSCGENTQCEIIGYADHCPKSYGACAEFFEIISIKQK